MSTWSISETIKRIASSHSVSVIFFFNMGWLKLCDLLIMLNQVGFTDIEAYGKNDDDKQVLEDLNNFVQQYSDRADTLFRHCIYWMRSFTQGVIYTIGRGIILERCQLMSSCTKSNMKRMATWTHFIWLLYSLQEIFTSILYWERYLAKWTEYGNQKEVTTTVKRRRNFLTTSDSLRLFWKRNGLRRLTHVGYDN